MAIEPSDEIGIEDYVLDDDWDTVCLKLGPLYVQFKTSNISSSGSGIDKSVNVVSNNDNNNGTHLDLIQANEILLTIEYMMKRFMAFHYSTIFKTLQILGLEEISSTALSDSTGSTSMITMKVRGVKIYFSELTPDKIDVVRMLQKAFTVNPFDDTIMNKHQLENNGVIRVASIDMKEIRLQWGEKRYEYSSSTATATATATTTSTLDSLNSSSMSLTPTESPMSIGHSSEKSSHQLLPPNDSHHTEMVNGPSFSTLYGIISVLLAFFSIFVILRRHRLRQQRWHTRNHNFRQTSHHSFSNTNTSAGHNNNDDIFQNIIVSESQSSLTRGGNEVSQFPLKLLDKEHYDSQSYCDFSYNFSTCQVNDNEKRCFV